jgi:DUF2934 family protein
MNTTDMRAKTTRTSDVSRANKEAIASQAEDGRINCIATMAYYLAQARGFTPGREVEDWMAAEAEFDGNEGCR